jgi:4-amino-4-deoxy-L-arabinose transferase-like glycosyltransferase
MSKKLRNLWTSWKRYLFYLFLILTLGFFLRFYRLTSLPIFGDEAIYIRWAQVMRAETTLRFIPLSDGKQPLFMWCVIAFLKIFSDPLFAGRLVSVLAGLGTLMGIFVLTNLLTGNKKVSLFSSLIYSISPYTVFFDRMALVDSSLTMFGVWTLVFALITSRKVRLDTAMLTGFCLGAALLTKSPAIYFAILLPSVLLLAKWPKKLKDIFNRLSVFVFLFFFTYLIAFGMYNILRLGPNFHMIGLRNKDYVYPLSHILTSPLDPLKPFLLRSIEWFWKLGPSVFVLFLITGILRGLKEKTKSTLLLIIWGFVPLIVSAEFARVFTTRYILYTLPYLVTLASLVFVKSQGVKLSHIGGVVVSHLGKVAWEKLLLSIFITQALWIDILLLTNVEKVPLPRIMRSGYLEEWTAGTGIREVSALIRSEYQQNPDQKIVVGTEGYFGTLPDAMQIYLNDLSEITVIGTGIDFKETPIQLIESKQAGNKTYFVVNSSRLLTNPNDLNLKLIAAYPKSVRPDGSRDSLYLFEVEDLEINH